MKDTKKIYELFNYYNKNLISYNIDLNELNYKGDFLEVGPGDSLGLSYVFLKTGFKNAYAIDKDNYITKFGEKSLNKLDKRIFAEFSLATSINKNIKNKFLYDSINYLTNGINSLKEIKNKSISLIISNAAFEHIDKNEVNNYFKLFSKKLCKDGIFILRIDLKDHLVGDFFNHLISERYWESNLFKRGSHYTNRIKTEEFKNIIYRNKLKIIIVKNEKYTVNSFFNTDYSINLNSILNSQKVPSSIMIIGKK
ncbi:hypothetical protein [Prochlorococcus marinus]|uniref:hypothetical protein n=1 Tax=Prochlorococcus marinus TaxID=1219 RepID=UPI001ADA0799|nr:hypothetical protein [Prochlorococcus marinus]MBO8204940.1 hypothetical protein [Prochlorococcus marinus CUG1415]